MSIDDISCPLSEEITSDPKQDAISPSEFTPISSKRITTGTTPGAGITE